MQPDLNRRDPIDPREPPGDPEGCPGGPATDRPRTAGLTLLDVLLGPDRRRPEPVLLAVTPPRTGERTMLGVENLLQSIAVPEPFSLELAADAAGVTLLARCLDGEVVRGQFASHYAQARLREVPPTEDPLRLRPGEAAWGMTLRSSGPDYVPLRSFGDRDLLDAGSDPLLAILGPMTTLREGERIVARLLLRSLGPDWSKHHQELALKGPRADRPLSADGEQARAHQADGVSLALLGAGVLAAVRGYLWVRDGETLKAALFGSGVAAALAAGGWAWWRFNRSRSRAYDPLLIREKTSRIAFDGELQITAVMPGPDAAPRAAQILGRVAAAYRHFDHPAGARFRVGPVRPVVPAPVLHPRRSGLLGGRSVLGVREAAALWHPPGAGDETPLLDRTGSRTLLPAERSEEGALVGDTTGDRPREVRFADDLIRRHHLYVARTRMGKSTLMHHIVAHKLREKAASRDWDAVVVVDPHADLVASLLEQVPPELEGQVRLIDLADDLRAPGINLLDARVFADRDRTAESVVRVARGLWDQWGPRMQSILEHTVKTLHEHNAHPETLPPEQHTILDGLRLLSDSRFRGRVLARVDDPYILDWWARDFAGWHRDYRAEALAPVQTRLGYYASSRRARAVLGQPASTIDVRRTILDGGVLLISTAQGQAGRDVAAMVGASLLNLVDAVIREQGSLPPERRRGVLVVVDEMQTMPGVDYEGMLSELGKFGASFVLATQSLAKLEEVSRGMRDSILANVGCLAVFQVAGADARQLVWELGKDRVTEDDITSLEVHHCYVRATVGARRMPAFSMQVRPPDDGDPAVAARIRAAALAYTTLVEEIAYRDKDAEERVAAYRRGLLGIRDKKPGKPAYRQPHGRNHGGGGAPPGAGNAERPPLRLVTGEREE
ncbi:MAG: type IV secretion system DNA-binding domain-containing protein [Chloroflexota bacterium]|nr:type IV secretion system DNA-binding domain-containing protein [Chloroflexota bacterium]